MTAPDSRDLRAVLDDLGDLGFEAAIEPAPDGGWVRLDTYVDDPRILDDGLRLAGVRFGRPEVSPLTGGWLVGEVAAATAWPATAAMLVAHAADVYLPRPDSGRARAICFASGGSPEPATPQAFADGIVAALRPVVDRVHRRTGRGRYALWGTVTDMVAAAFLRIGEHLHRGTEGRGLAEAVIDANPSLVGRTNWHDVVWSQGIERTHIRNICCLWYRTEGGDLCTTCPRITDAERPDIFERHHVPTD